MILLNIKIDIYKLLLVFLLLSISQVIYSQNTVIYQENVSPFSNPERGFYRHTETNSSNYNFLNVNTLTSYREDEDITLILRVFYLESFKNSDISNEYLMNIRTDLSRVRTAGLKCILRFAYNNDQTQTDAPKAVILGHLDQLKPIFDEFQDVIAVMQAGFIGSWGEWYYTSQTEFGLPGNTPNYENRGDVLFKILDVLPESRMVQLRTPNFKTKIFNDNTALTLTEAYNGSDNSRTGHHNDCFLASSTDYGTYSDISADKAYLSQECLYTVNGGETCNPSSYSNCPNALVDLENLRYSYLNVSYNNDVLQSWRDDGCMDDVIQNLGYRIKLKNGEFPEEGEKGKTINLEIDLENVGWGSIYNPRGVELILRSSTDIENVYKFPLLIDPRIWKPGNSYTISTSINLPVDMIEAEYDFLLNLPDTSTTLNNRPEYSIQLANQNVWESSTGYNDLLSSINIISVSQNTISLDLQVLLESCYDESTGKMFRDVDLPLLEPYSSLGYTIQNTNATITQGVLDQTEDDRIVDWIVVELRDIDDNSLVISKVGLLSATGNILGLDGTSNMEILTESRDVYVLIHHRNHLGVMSKNSFDMSTDISIDFTDISNVYTDLNVSNSPVNLDGGTSMLLKGDVNNDGIINTTDATETFIRAVPVQDGVYDVYDSNMDGIINTSDAQEVFINSVPVKKEHIR